MKERLQLYRQGSTRSVTAPVTSRHQTCMKQMELTDVLFAACREVLPLQQVRCFTSDRYSDVMNSVVTCHLVDTDDVLVLKPGVLIASCSGKDKDNLCSFSFGQNQRNQFEFRNSSFTSPLAHRSLSPGRDCAGTRQLLFFQSPEPNFLGPTRQTSATLLETSALLVVTRSY